MFKYSVFFIIRTFLRIFILYFNLSSMMNFCLRWDLISIAIFSLTIWITSLIILTEKGYFNKISILTITIIFVFSTKNILMFFLIFEFSIIPILIIVLLNGYQPERLTAGLRLLLYTFAGRTPLFFCILYSYQEFNSWNFFILTNSSVMFLTISIIGFLVKLPIWRIHIWLPKAHVESPVGGSIILASVILKLGIYGILRLFRISRSYLKPSIFFLMRVGLIGTLIRRLICLIRSDIKTLIAYRSVSHITPTLIILNQFNNIRTFTIFFLAISHGFSSSLLFYIRNLIYLNRKSRIIIIQKGSLISNPTITLILFWRVTLNLAIPPFLTFFSEIAIMVVIFIQSFTVLFILFFLILITGLYNIYFYINLGFGKEKSINIKILFLKEKLIFFIHSTPLVVLPLIL